MIELGQGLAEGGARDAQCRGQLRPRDARRAATNRREGSDEARMRHRRTARQLDSSVVVTLGAPNRDHIVMNPRRRLDGQDINVGLTVTYVNYWHK